MGIYIFLVFPVVVENWKNPWNVFICYKQISTSKSKSVTTFGKATFFWPNKPFAANFLVEVKYCKI